jgi:hypothetical protein
MQTETTETVQVQDLATLKPGMMARVVGELATLMVKAAHAAAARRLGAIDWQAEREVQEGLKAMEAHGLVEPVRELLVPDAPTDRDLQRAWGTLERDYHAHVDGLADDLLQELEEDRFDNREAFDTRVHETCDGSRWVFITHQARKTLAFTSHPNAAEEQGVEATTTEAQAYWALRADLDAALGNLGVDLDHPTELECGSCGTWTGRAEAKRKACPEGPLCPGCDEDRQTDADNESECATRWCGDLRIDLVWVPERTAYHAEVTSRADDHAERLWVLDDLKAPEGAGEPDTAQGYDAAARAAVAFATTWTSGRREGAPAWAPSPENADFMAGLARFFAPRGGQLGPDVRRREQE